MSAIFNSLLEIVARTPCASGLSITVMSWLKRFIIVPISVEVKNASGALRAISSVANLMDSVLHHYSKEGLVEYSAG
jgi:hypothetical protein